MKNSRTISLALLAASAFTLVASAAEEKKPEDFNARKTEILSRIDERAKNLQEHRGCVAAAADDAALKKCREGMHAFMKEHREEMREHMKEMRERRANKKKKSESTEASS